MPVYWADTDSIRGYGDGLRTLQRHTVSSVADSLDQIPFSWCLPPDELGPARAIDSMVGHLRRVAGDVADLGDIWKKQAHALERLDAGPVSFRAFGYGVDLIDSVVSGSGSLDNTIKDRLKEQEAEVLAERKVQEGIVFKLEAQADRLIESIPLPKAEVQRLQRIIENARVEKLGLSELRAASARLARYTGGVRAAGRLLDIVGYAMAPFQARDLANDSDAVYRPVQVLSGAAGASMDTIPEFGLVDVASGGLVSKTPEQILVPAEALGRLLAGDPDWTSGMESLNDHNLAGDNGPVFMGAAYIGEYSNNGVNAIAARL